MSNKTDLVALPTPTPEDLKRLVSYDSKLRLRALVEMAIVRRLVTDLIVAGRNLSVDSGGDEPDVEHSTLVTEIMDACFAVDEARIHTYLDGDKFTGSISLVFGNSGCDVISDYHTSLEPLLKPTEDYAEQLSEWF